MMRLPGVGLVSAAATVLVPAIAAAAMQSALDPAGQQAARIDWLWWLIFGVCTAVYILVMGGLAAALWRRHRPEDAPPTEPGRERRIGGVVASCVGVTVAILLVFLVASYSVDSALFTAPDSPSVQIEVTGHQWWWEIRYQDPVPSRIFTTANEIHLPVGEPVRLTLRSPDVIHSFWVPNLAGKRDLIPGQINYIWITAERPGTYRGQCAEFCGLQHAHMALYVTVEDRPAFEHWQERQRQPAPSPSTPEAQRGLEVFLSGPCVMCHTILGTTAGATTGPDLTHIGGRQMIAAGLLETTRGSLAAWIADPQTLKQGNNMPMVPLTSAELQNISAYMESLK